MYKLGHWWTKGYFCRGGRSSTNAFEEGCVIGPREEAILDLISNRWERYIDWGSDRLSDCSSMIRKRTGNSLSGTRTSRGSSISPFCVLFPNHSFHVCYNLSR